MDCLPSVFKVRWVFGVSIMVLHACAIFGIVARDYVS